MKFETNLPLSKRIASVEVRNLLRGVKANDTHTNIKIIRNILRIGSVSDFAQSVHFADQKNALPWRNREELGKADWASLFSTPHKDCPSDQKLLAYLAARIASRKVNIEHFLGLCHVNASFQAIC